MKQPIVPEAIHAAVESTASKLKAYPKLARMFRNCFPNTLETTTEMLEDGTTFVITGDIPAMWLRDSSCQVNPYLPLLNGDADLARIFRGLIQRQFMYIAIDPYANAFNRSPDGSGHQKDRTVMGPWIWERKYEIDSLCYPVRLAHAYWKALRDTSLFDAGLKAGLTAILELWTREQRHETESRYTFERQDCLASDTLPCGGRGTPVAYTGMTWSGFRPSDDACVHGYLIPANMLAVVTLGAMAEIANEAYADRDLARRALDLRAEIETGLRRFGTVRHPKYGTIWAYEVDGFGHQVLMDDANVPSLLAAPYLGYCAVDDPLYAATRRFILSRDNPYYYTGTRARGVGSPHTPPGYVWPIALAMQGMTSRDPDEVKGLLATLAGTDAGTDFMHESFDPNDPTRFSREWFAWANSLFGEWIFTLATQAPEGLAL